LDAQSPAWKLWEKAKELGVWNPAAVDLARDREDWQRLDEGERDVLLRLTSLFVGGEEAVTVHLLPLVQVIAAEGRLEEEMFLTAFLFEEAKHVDAFHRFLVEVAQERSDLSRYHSPSWRVIFHEELPRAMGRLRHDPSPLAQAEASATYNMIVEGVLAETGYHGYHATLGRNGILPGMQELVSLIKRDESRHIAYGVHLLSRLAAEGGEEVWAAIQRRLSELLPAAIGVIGELFAAYDTMPFGLDLAEFTDYAQRQFASRVNRIERARANG
jgi:ribonucleoside-diphosphate reductase beta chain